ncbi:MAG: hypothetical protein OEV44_14470 [Spirochaetota bacterium]|nr:hypothetical protein [Spirochaetota bacterium]
MKKLILVVLVAFTFGVFAQCGDDAAKPAEGDQPATSQPASAVDPATQAEIDKLEAKIAKDEKRLAKAELKGNKKKAKKYRKRIAKNKAKVEALKAVKK